MFLTDNDIAIIGSGAFACAVYSTIRDVKKNNISMFFYDKDCYDFVLKNGRHNKMNCEFSKSTFLTTDITEAIKGKKTIFLCCIFAVACDVIDNMIKNMDCSEMNIVICCKGMIKKEPFFLHDYIYGKIERANIFVFSGGSFADEMCKKQDTFVNLACKNKDKAKELCHIFDSFLHIDINDKIRETEFFGAVKNVMATYCGYVSIDNSINTTIGNLVIFLQEIGDFFDKVGFDKNTIFSQSGIGDIMLTCLSGKSRNRTFGELLGSDFKKACEYAKSTTIEGLEAIKSVINFCNFKQCKINKVEELNNIILKNICC